MNPIPRDPPVTTATLPSSPNSELSESGPDAGEDEVSAMLGSMADTNQVLEIRRASIGEAEVHEEPLTELDEGQIRLRVDRFAVTANNVSYAGAGIADVVGGDREPVDAQPDLALVQFRERFFVHLGLADGCPTDLQDLVGISHPPQHG